jgi:CheY-like chemotaxis protein
MIVEDNELNMKLFHDLLEAYGYRTIGTNSQPFTQTGNDTQENQPGTRHIQDGKVVRLREPVSCQGRRGKAKGEPVAA